MIKRDEFVFNGEKRMVLNWYAMTPAELKNSVSAIINEVFSDELEEMSADEKAQLQLDWLLFQHFAKKGGK